MLVKLTVIAVIGVAAFCVWEHTQFGWELQHMLWNYLYGRPAAC